MKIWRITTKVLTQCKTKPTRLRIKKSATTKRKKQREREKEKEKIMKKCYLNERKSKGEREGQNK